VPEVSPENKQIARHAAAALGGRPRVTKFWDEAHERSVDILICADRPAPGLTSYSTLALSDTPLLRKGCEYPVRVELVGACDSNVEDFANALGTAALFVITDRWFCRPGVVFKTLISMYQLSKTMEHLYFTAPSLWPELNKTLTLSAKTVTWLWAIPISDSESDYIASSGDAQFESLLERSNAEVFNIDRPSVV